MKLLSTKTVAAILAAAVLFTACAAGPAQGGQNAQSAPEAQETQNAPDPQSAPGSQNASDPQNAPGSQNAPAPQSAPGSDTPPLSTGTPSLSGDDDTAFSETPSETPSAGAAVSVSELAMRSGVNGLAMGCDAAGGYYEFDAAREPVALFYTDYATRQRVPLCARPECTHSDETCTAVLTGASGILEMDGRLFVFCAGQDGAFSVLKMNANGSEQETVITLNSADRYNNAFAGAQDSLFTVAQMYSAGRNMQVPELIHMDLRTGRLQTLTKLDSRKSWFLVGAAGECLLLKSIEQASGTQFGSSEAYASQVHELFLYHVPQGKLTSVLSWRQDEFLDVCYEDKLFLYDPAGAAFSVQRFGADGLEPLLTSELLPLQNARDAYFYGFYDGRLVVELGENFAADSGGADYRWHLFAVDAQSGAVSQLTLGQTYQGVTEFVRPIAGSNGMLLVKNGTREELRTVEGQDGSLQQYSVYVPAYALMESADFFAGNPQFIEIR